MTILAIETSTNHGSVAVLSNGQPIFFERFPADRRTSTVLFTVLERALALCQTLDQVAVGLGPGSYAGVRIAIAAALGLELGRGPLVVGISSVSTLETPAQTYFAIGDARRQTFYLSKIESGLTTDGPRLVTADQLHAYLADYPDIPALTSAPLPEFPTAQLAAPSALRLAQLAHAQIGIIATRDLEPIYLRDPHITLPKFPPKVGFSITHASPTPDTLKNPLTPE